MNVYRYILEPYTGMNSRYHCPNCGNRDKTFTRYIDTDTGLYINERVGRCSRENHCAYHYTPSQYFKDIHFAQKKEYIKPKAITHEKAISFFPVELVDKTLKGYDHNHFILYLEKLLGKHMVMQQIQTYLIGSSKHATVFWQIDINGNARTGKIIPYDPKMGKRLKSLNTPVYWTHKTF